MAPPSEIRRVGSIIDVSETDGFNHKIEVARVLADEASSLMKSFSAN